jgi:hypothetical protein
MEGESVLYCGRLVPVDNFRVFVYGAGGSQKLVNTWIEYENAMATGLWFPTKDEVEAHFNALEEEKSPQPGSSFKKRK